MSLQKYYKDEYPNYYGGGYDITLNERFYLDGINDVIGSKIIEFPVFMPGYLIGVGMKLDIPRISGTAGIVIYKNEVPCSDIDLNIQLNESYPLDRTQFVAFRTESYSFEQGDLIAVKLNISNDFEPKENIGSIYLNYRVNREL